MGRKADAENRTAAAASSLSDLKSNSHFLERMRLRKEVSLPDPAAAGLKFRLQRKGKSSLPSKQSLSLSIRFDRGVNSSDQQGLDLSVVCLDRCRSSR
jgi:hypothetical protein